MSPRPAHYARAYFFCKKTSGEIAELYTVVQGGRNGLGWKEVPDITPFPPPPFPISGNCFPLCMHGKGGEKTVREFPNRRKKKSA